MKLYSVSTEEVIIICLLLFVLGGFAVLADRASQRNHEKYVLCIQSHSEWIGGDCVRKVDTVSE